MNIAVILSGGVGARFGGDTPKQFRTLNGREVIDYAVATAVGAKHVDKIIITAAEQYKEQLTAQYDAQWVEGGNTHNESVKNALDYIANNFHDCINVVFLDAVRPFVPSRTVDMYIEMLGDYDGVITAQAITDSLGRDGEMFTDRTNFYLIQKPEAFKLKLLYSCFEADSDCTAIVQQLPRESRIMKRFDLRQNMKITYPEDLFVAEQIMKLGEGLR